MSKSRERSSQLFQRATSISPGGVHSPVRAFAQVAQTPIFMESARGASITDADNNHYTDYCMAFGPLILGHQDPRVSRAAEQALQDGWSFGTAERYSLELAEFIQSRIPWAEQIRFVNSGTEAVMSALRLARAATGRARVLKFSGCYHGHADSMLIEAGSGLAGTAGSAGISPAVADETIVCELGNLSQLQQAFTEYGTELAAAIIEPLPANNGLLIQTPEFLQTLQSLCQQHGSLLIFDEVISGFRVGFGGCAAQLDIVPDLVTWGKIIGGGFPVGAYAGRRELLQMIAPAGDVYQAGTLSANPLAMRAGLATLRALIDSDVYTQLEKLGSQLETGCAEFAGINIVRAGSIFWLRPAANATLPSCPSDVPAAQLAAFPTLFAHLLTAGIYLPPSPWEVCFLSAAHTEQDIDALLNALSSFQ